MNLLLAKMAALALTTDRGRKTAGWVLAAILSPVILVIAGIIATASGEARHNVQTVEACFYGAEISDNAPQELKEHIEQIPAAFSLLDAAISEVNRNMDDGLSLDPIQVKAVFLALCFGDPEPTRRAADRFVDCFYSSQEMTRTVEREDGAGNIITETYTRTAPVSLAAAYANLQTLLGREITDEDMSNIVHIYSMIAGDKGSVDYDGSYTVSESYAVEIDPAIFSSPATKNAADLAAYVTNAYNSGWGYVWGTFGQVLTESALESKIEQYPDDVGVCEDFIREHWVGRRTTDCVGLIKSYSWYDVGSDSLVYNSNDMPDISANQMYYAAAESGPIATMPEIPGLAVWSDGHIGVYIGNGQVIEAMGTMYGVVKTQMTGNRWTCWLKIPYILYE